MRNMLKCIFGLILCPCLLAAQALMTNGTVINMAKAGLSDGIIISSIDSQPGAYATNPDDLIALKHAGVSDKVIAAMIARSTGKSPSNVQPSNSSDLPGSPGAGATVIASGIVEAATENGDLKQARFAEIYVLPAQQAEQVKDVILTASQKLEDARAAAQRMGWQGQISDVETQCLTFVGKLKISLATAGMDAIKSGASQYITITDADETGKFQLKGVVSDPFVLIAVGKAGMNAAIWISEARSTKQKDFIKLNQPVLSCYDEKGVF